MLVIDADFLITNHSVQRLKTLLIAEAIISLSLFYQLLCILHINSGSLALTLNIRTAAAILVWSLIVDQTGFFQGSVNDIYSAFYITLLVSIFYS